MMFDSVNKLNDYVAGTLNIQDSNVEVINLDSFRQDKIEEVVFNAVFNVNEEVKNHSRFIIKSVTDQSGIVSASIQNLYDAIGRKEYSGFTVPAINVRGLCYDMSTAIFRAAIKNNVGPFIFEIAKSEIGYTAQRPAECKIVILAAAIREGYKGPVFIQGDHFQINAKKYKADPDAEVMVIKDLIEESINADFYNIDIDTSTLVDLSKPDISEQQRLNYELAAEFTAYIREREPTGTTISVGGEIGEVGGKNSTVEELCAYMDGYKKTLEKKGTDLKGLSKISVQTGTTHGGIPLPDGSIAKVKIDFETIEKLGEVSRNKYGLGGVVQHGASTLPSEVFDNFPKKETLEIHLATEFQNMIFDSEVFPKDLKQEVYDYLREKCADEKKPDQTDEQFFYKTRKKANGPFKEKMWNLPKETRETISDSLEKKFDFLFDKLNVVNTKNVIEETVCKA